MPDLLTSFRQHDVGHLYLLAEHWGFELSASDSKLALHQLVEGMLNPELVLEVFGTLPAAAQRALQDLIDRGGRIPWHLFTRQHGAIREVGAGRRDRERPDLHPVSIAEVIWYHGMIARTFLDTIEGPLEFAYIPDDLLQQLPPPTLRQPDQPGRQALPKERAFPTSIDDLILDDACTMLAFLRSGLSLESITHHNWALKVQHPRALYQILLAAELVDDTGDVQPENTRLFLEAPRGQALTSLAQAWLHSKICNDLRLVPDLHSEGTWENDPLRPRRAVIKILASIPADTWWSLSALIEGVQAQYPDFLRPTGDFDTWYLRDGHTGEYLLGYEHWRQVEGAYLRYLVAGPLHWLGFLDLAAPAENAAPTALRRSAWWEALLDNQPHPVQTVELEVLLISSDARIRVPRLAPRAARYQIARFADWEASYPEAFNYRLTPVSLARGRQQGLTVHQMLGVLRRYAQTVPPSLARAIERWDTRGPEAHLEQALILRVSSPELLKSLRQSKAGRFLGDPLGPTTVIVRPNAAARVLAALAEMGYFGEIQLNSGEDAGSDQADIVRT